MDSGDWINEFGSAEENHDVFFYRWYLKKELSKRAAEKSGYSTKAFATDLALSYRQLSRILGGAVPLSVRLARQMIETLRLEPDSARLFIESVLEEHRKRGLSDFFKH